MEQQTKKPWYKTPGGIILLVLFLPITITVLVFVFMGKASKKIWNQNWNLPTRLAALALLWGVFFNIGAAGNASNQATLGATSTGEKEIQKVQSAQAEQPTVAQATNTPAPTNTIQPTVPPTNTPYPTRIVYPTKVYFAPTRVPPTAVPQVQNQAPQVAAPAQGSVSSGGDKDCGDFSGHAEAQAYFVSKGGSPSNNVDGLDRDHDGIACE